MEKNNTTVELAALQQAVQALTANLHKVIIGQDAVINQIIAALLANGHILLEGVPGVAKTLLAKLTAQSINTGFSRIQFTPDLMPSDITGTSVFSMKTSEFFFNKGPLFSNIILIDEINRSPAKTQAALFEVMEERQITVDGTRYAMEEPFLVIATQNPVEHEGTYRLPEAQLDRFLFKVVIGYPSEAEEREMLLSVHARGAISSAPAVQAVLQPEGLAQFKRIAASVTVDPKIADYIVRIVNKTRNNADIYLGASPRAAVNLMVAARVFAAMAGRDFVTPDDVQTAVLPVLRHRIIITPDKEMEGATTDEVIRAVVSSVEIPR